MEREEAVNESQSRLKNLDSTENEFLQTVLDNNKEEVEPKSQIMKNKKFEEDAKYIAWLLNNLAEEFSEKQRSLIRGFPYARELETEIYGTQMLFHLGNMLLLYLICKRSKKNSSKKN